MSVVLFVRVRSDLDLGELERRAAERKPRFLEVPGLLQKMDVREPESGDVCGMDFFESRAALAAFRESELARTIPAACEAREVRPEVFDVMYPLREDVGPIFGAPR